ncbi:MAG: C4-dicarboxylic acid transporter DauA [Deltaproteobacteria bacterium]|nr:C4-dicarboxylic acid transporter DauA [Deltaproteobacteria bacterium]
MRNDRGGFVPHRKQSLSPRPPPRPGPSFASALRAALRHYDGPAFRADLLAGGIVGIVALPLSMALAIAVGVPPQHGLYTAIVGGFVVAAAGGSRFQVTGPTAAFVVILAPIAARHGVSGLLFAGMLAGLMLLAMGLAGAGRLIQFIPYPVTSGFTAGIATVIATLQLKDALGLEVAHMPEHFPAKVAALWAAHGTVSLPEVAIAATTLALLLVLPRLTDRVPAPLAAIVLAAAAAVGLGRLWPDVHVATLADRFSTTIGGHVYAGIPPLPPQPHLPWTAELWRLDALRELVPAAFTIAILGAIESLLSAVVADGMTGTRHDPDTELVALGLGNVAAPFFGGIAATGALARTATNIRAGARSPVAAMTHALVVLLAVLLLAPLVGYVPMAALAGLLLLVAWNMSEIRHFLHVARVGPRSDAFVLLSCFSLTVIFDMVLAVSVGVVLAALLFLKRMSELTHGRLLADPNGQHGPLTVPPHVALYEINGPLFFGAAQSAMTALDTIGADVRVVVLALGRVPTIDATGLVALESALERLHRDRKFVLIAGPLPEPRHVFGKANLRAHHENIVLESNLEQALRTAGDLVLLNPQWKSHAAAASSTPKAVGS